MTNFTMLLGLVMVAYFSVSQAENAFLQYWEKHITSHPPHLIAAKASPLSPEEVAMFIKFIEKNELDSHLTLFCKLANIACSTNALVKNAIVDTTLPPIAPFFGEKNKYDDAPNEIPLSIASQGGLSYFRQSMVKEGGFMPIADLRDHVSYKSFLPRPLASKIPFSFAHVEELKKLFGVVDENMDDYIERSLKICEMSETQGEQRSCVNSAEDLIDFVVDKLGHHINIWSTKNVEGSYENVTIGAVKLIHGNLSEPPALCHSIPFIYQIYYCHILPKVKVYAVDIHAKKKVNHVIMACHYDTSTWSPNHLAFKLLGFGPGLIEVCHWINQNGIVWTKIP